MNGRFFPSGAPANPVMQVLYLLVGGVLLVGALVMGAVILAFMFGLAMIFGIVVWLRVWWLRRKMRKTGRGRAGGARRRDASSGEVIEVEYTVVEEREPRDDERE